MNAEEIIEGAVMKIEEIMEIDISNLAEKKFNALRNDTLSRLAIVIGRIRDGRFESIEECTEYSPSGDDMGTEHNYIAFYNEMDIVEVAEELKRLKAAMGGD